MDTDNIADLGAHFAKFLCRLADRECLELTLAARLVSHAVASGHSCIDLRATAGQPVGATAAQASTTIAPPFEQWVGALRRSGVVGAPGDYRPLVLDDAGRLYLHRYLDYERRLAAGLRARARSAVEDIDEQLLRDGLARLFPQEKEPDIDWQKVAAAVAVLRRLCVISGRPGTGKTTTVVRVLALLIEHARGRPLRIALAAPTGKAAARLQEAVRLAAAQLPVDDHVRAQLLLQASTLHRLLGGRPDTVHFRHDRERPLPIDVLVVDEVSMVDLALMAKLVDATPPQARLILLGDKDQLAAVEPGAVLGDLCADEASYSAEFAGQLRRVTGASIIAADQAASPLRDCIVLFERSYRFSERSGIGQLARAISQGDSDSTISLLRRVDVDDVRWRQSPVSATRELAARIEGGFRDFLAIARSGADATRVFDRFNRFRVLCAHRYGPGGAETINQLIERHLRSARVVPTQAIWYPGRPVVVTRNDYGLRLYNGDLGITVKAPSGGDLRVAFQDSGGGIRFHSPARLPAHETAYALTVHKAQGSEFDDVVLLLPEADSPILSRELLYTAVTRARRRVEIWATESVLAGAITRALVRTSGLRDALLRKMP